MDKITYITERRIKQIKKLEYRSMEQEIAVFVYNKILSEFGYLNGTLKELEGYLGHRLDAQFQIHVPKNYWTGIHGIEYATNRTVRYTSTNDLSLLSIDDFNSFVEYAAREIT